MTGLYDHQGVLRFSGRDNVECLEYAELFSMDAGSYILASLEKHDVDPGAPHPVGAVMERSTYDGMLVVSLP
jgi:hypothetical protein